MLNAPNYDCKISKTWTVITGDTNNAYVAREPRDNRIHQRINRNIHFKFVYLDCGV